MSQRNHFIRVFFSKTGNTYIRALPRFASTAFLEELPQGFIQLKDLSPLENISTHLA